MSHEWRCAGLAATAALAAAAALAAPLAAQSQGNGFLFRVPTGSFALRVGYARPNAGSDVYSSFLTNQLTLGRGDFGASDIAGDLAFRVAPRLDAALGLAYAGSRARSEYQHWVDQNDLPIEQRTTLQRVPLTASLKWYLEPRGRSIGRFAWLPRRYVPYVGVGAGAMWYRLHLWGDFVADDSAHSVYTDSFSSADWALTGHAFAGLDVSVSPRFVVTGEARYTYAKAPLSADFQNFDRIDLSGFSLTAGVAVRF
jgi:hypothetical protein